MLETIATGYGLLEGPRVDDAGNLYFSDVTNGGVYCRTPDGEISTVVPRRRGVGGIALHADGGLVISGRNVCHVKDGTTRILFQRDDIPGFNDLFTDSQGRILVGALRSDPFKLKSQVPGELWRLCWTPEEAVEGLREFSNRDESTRERHQELARVVRREYFQEVTSEGVDRFLGVEGKRG